MPLKPSFPTRLIVDLPNWLGDQMMAVPALDRLLSANAGGLTVLHTRPAASRFFQDLFPGVRVVAGAAKMAPWKSARRLRRGGGRFPLGVTLRHADRAKLMLWLAARTTLGSDSGAAARLLSERFVVDRNRHQVHDADPLLRGLGLNGVDASWRPTVPAALAAEGRQRLGDMCGHPGPVVGLAPAAAWGRSKIWPDRRFGLVARRLIENGCTPVVIIGPGEVEVARRVTDSAGCGLRVVGEDLDVAGLAAVMTRLSAVVGNDSGPVHLAAMMSTPVVALFGPTDPARTAPLGERKVVLRRQLACVPCGQPVCPLDHHDCLCGISVDDVVRAVHGMLR